MRFALLASTCLSIYAMFNTFGLWTLGIFALPFAIGYLNSKPLALPPHRSARRQKLAKLITLQ